MEIRPFVGSEATESELRRHYALRVASSAVEFPGFPDVPFEVYAHHARQPENTIGPRHAWSAWDAGELVGFATVSYFQRHDLNAAVPHVDVASNSRRRGVATDLLREIVADVRAEGRNLLVNEQVRIGSPAEHWVRAAGFAEVLRKSWQMLHIAQTDPSLWDDVLLPPGFRLEHWVDTAPAQLVARFAAARNAIEDAPTGESSYEHVEWTVEKVRQAEADARAVGDEVRHVVAVHEATGEVAALTGMVVDPGFLDMCWQRDTAVVREFRGRGLGRAVKAAMMRNLLADYPTLGSVVTSTATANRSMRRVNEQVGYAHYADIGMFEATVDAVEEAISLADARRDASLADAHPDRPLADAGPDPSLPDSLPSQRRDAATSVSVSVSGMVPTQK